MSGEIKHIDVGDELTKAEWESTTSHIINDVAALQTSLFATALPENVSMILDTSISTEGNYSGITEAGTLGETVLVGQVVYLNSSGK